MKPKQSINRNNYIPPPQADVLGLKSAESLDYFLMATWLIMAASGKPSKGLWRGGIFL